jgi:hypothetical protein
METLKSIEELEKRIEQIKIRLASLADMRPGSLSEQYNVCGNPTCRCKDPTNPQRHGPYYQLSYVHKGKHTTQFIRRPFLRQVRTEIANYKRFRKMTDEWVDCALQLAKLKLKAAAQTESE